MPGFILLAGFLLCGIALMDALVPHQPRLTRLWLGASAGLMLMMWLPALYAYATGFTRLAQLLGLTTAGVLAAAFCLWARKTPREHRFTDMPLWLPLALLLPLGALSGYLQYTHILRNVGGALHVGQSTYGDLCLHLGIATSLRGAAWPPDYSLLPGTLLGYPFLGDSMVTSMLLFGADLTQAFVVTGTLMMVLVELGFVIFCWDLTRSRAATVLATVLMFVNGGLGFLYSLDGIWRDSSAFRAIFTGFYLTPTNQPALNLRWVNVICDMMIPQRTLLTGWMAVVCALWLLMTAIRREDIRLFAVLGIWAGAMPMIHTHSFLALGLISVGAVIYTMIHTPKGSRQAAFARFALYGALAIVLALPQLLTWSFPQTVHGGSLRFRFNWVNNQGNGRLIDGYCWFWIKNVGLIWLMMIPAALGPKQLAQQDAEALERRRMTRLLGLGALFVYVVAETIQFQPNEYDNNKLFYVAYMVMLPAVGLYLVHLWDRLKGVRGRALLACAFIIASTLSGALTIGREVVSDYQLFDRAAVGAAEYIEQNAPSDAVVLTGTQHNNPIAALTGRDIVCGTGSYLYFHGIDYSRQLQDERLMLESPAENTDLLNRYGISYVYISSYERSDFDVDEAWFEENCSLVYSEGDIRLYQMTDIH